MSKVQSAQSTDQKPSAAERSEAAGDGTKALYKPNSLVSPFVPDLDDVGMEQVLGFGLRGIDPEQCEVYKFDSSTSVSAREAAEKKVARSDAAEPTDRK